jgi:hypothetical protein
VTSWQPTVVEVVGRFVSASNATLLGHTPDGEAVVYKPAAGERPLWDFPHQSLAAREVLTFEIARAMGLDVVPETVLGEGPYGPGSIQRFIEIDEDFDPVPSIRRGDPALWPVAVLDIVCNNADRKAGHLLRETGTGHLYAIDHGLTFHPEDKVRTVLWAFAGTPIPDHLVAAVDRLAAALAAGLGVRVADLLDARCAVALEERVRRVLADPEHPLPPVDRPAVPWPPY